jgi:poly-gamma-glutamate capsule biosynthesis protein CapA/YwtB (metallophosphatase superfamily)
MIVRRAFLLATLCISGGSAFGQIETLSIVAVGDIMLGTNYPDDRLAANDGADLLSQVAPVLRAADITIGNLEGVLMAGGTAAKTCSSPQRCFLFRSPPHYAGYLRDAGFDALSLANNHARDFGEEGRTATMQTLDAYGIFHSGRRGDIASWRVGDLDIAFIAFSPTRISYLLNDIPVAVELVLELKTAHDLVIVSFHGGAEGESATRLPFEEEFYLGETRGEVVRFSRGVIDAGADLVVGHGPHVPRALELYRDRLIAYSLGNFATQFGVNVQGIAGWAPILEAEIAADGSFLRGRIHSAVQVRPSGPRWDEENRAFDLIRGLTAETFGAEMFEFADDGSFVPGATRLP